MDDDWSLSSATDCGTPPCLQTLTGFQCWRAISVSLYHNVLPSSRPTSRHLKPFRSARYTVSTYQGCCWAAYLSQQYPEHSVKKKYGDSVAPRVTCSHGCDSSKSYDQTFPNHTSSEVCVTELEIGTDAVDTWLVVNGLPCEMDIVLHCLQDLVSLHRNLVVAPESRRIIKVEADPSAPSFLLFFSNILHSMAH